jgi:hypothetical protein
MEEKEEAGERVWESRTAVEETGAVRLAAAADL